ncbi:putative oxidoreductase [Psychromicrobium silvestre]|uniref:Putative oxidoreductase n=1 Tax=Psychromicrobium silvestre TaxID=1645614 RepID=A0A7Y9LQT1_9MICC|nr:SDR family NAD(P)-dependent oxidoreductase [Psychromicrobium silvestre]NYE93893.1 putative oxidoreductase [Psychromicrobium silvestre]
MKLSGNTVLITGGASGIGFELATQLSSRGNKVIITGRDQAKLDAAKDRLPGLVTIVSDVSDPAAITALFEEVESIAPDLNILINNAGQMRSINLNKSTDDLAGLTQEVDTNLIGAIRMVAQFLPLLASQPEAAIMNVSSGLAIVPLPISPVYCATKAAVHSYTQSLRVQLKNSRVKVFELLPPATETPLLDSFDGRDMEGTKVMPVQEMVAVAIDGLAKDVLEICPGQSAQLRFMNRLAPKFILKQLSKSVDAMIS